MEVEKLKYFISIFLYNFEDTVSNFDKGMFRKILFVVQAFIVKQRPNIKVSLFVFKYQTAFSF